MAHTLNLLRALWLRKEITSVLVSMAIAGNSHASEFTKIEADKSDLIFVYKQMGVPVEGRINKFNAQLKFDPIKTTLSKASIDLDVASIDAGSQEANESLSDKDWFNTKAYPKITFVATGIKSLVGNRYEVTGKMTIKGHTQNISAFFTFTPQGNTGIVDGTFILKRADFSIGEGSWADFGTVANEVQIKFHFLTIAEK